MSSAVTWDTQRCIDENRHVGSTRHAQLACPVQLEPHVQAAWDRFDTATSKVLRSTHQVTASAELRHGNNGMTVLVPLAEYERLASVVAAQAKLKQILNELLS